MCKRVLSMPRSDVQFCSMQQQICASCGALLKARLLMMPAVHIHAEGAALSTFQDIHRSPVMLPGARDHLYCSKFLLQQVVAV